MVRRPSRATFVPLLLASFVTLASSGAAHADDDERRDEDAPATEERRGPAPFVLDAAMGLRHAPGDGIGALGGALRLTYRPSPTHCIHLLLEGFGGSTLAPDVDALDATLATGSLGALWGFPSKTTFVGVGVAADLGYARLGVVGGEATSGLVSSVGMRALVRSRMKRGFHVHAALSVGAYVRPLTVRFVGGREGLEGLTLGLDLGASFDLARAR